MTPQSPASRYRPIWRTPVGKTKTEKAIGDVEMTATGFVRRTQDGFVRVGERG